MQREIECESLIFVDHATKSVRASFDLSIDFLHLGRLLVGALNLLERRKVVVTRIIVVVDAQAELDHAVDAPGELRRLIQRESRRQQRRVEQEPDEVLHGLVRLVRGSLLLKLRHDGVVRVHLHGLLRHHVGNHGAVRRACAFMMRSMFADQPCSEVTRMHGESAMRVPTSTFSTLSPRTSLMSLQSGSYSAFSSSVFFFSSSVSRSRPSFVTDLSFLLSYSLSC